jgi:lysophospholipase
MARRDEGFFSARDNTRLYWQTVLPDSEPTCFVGVVHGYGDHSGRYRRVIDYLAGEGVGAMAFDYRGHGKADGRRGDCRRWADFVDDLEVFWARVRGAAQGRPTFLLAHSHGALMALHWILKRPEGVKGLVLSSPYLKLALDPPALKVMAAKAAGLLIPWLPVSTGISYEQLSRDLAWQRETEEDALYGKKTTPRFFVQSTQAQAALEGKGKQITLPVYLATGGADPIAATATSRAFFETLGSADKTYDEREGMRHEVLCEVGKEALWGDISRWISAHR